MSLLTIVQDACGRMGLTRPSSVIGATQPQMQSLLDLTQQEGKALARRTDWQRLIKESTFTASATEEQTGVYPADVQKIIPGTAWNRTRRRRVAGPISPQRWQLLKSGLIVIPWDSYRIRGNDWLMSPTPTAGDVFYFEYTTKYWCGASTDVEPTQEAFAVDTDISFLPDELLTLGLIWRWRQARGLDYTEAFMAYEREVALAAGVDGGQADLDMGLGDDGTSTIDPYITDGNWSIN